MVDTEFYKKYHQIEINSYLTILFLSDMVVNFDQGSIPAANARIREQMGLDYFGYGALGTAVFAGLGIGGVYAYMVFRTYDYIRYVLASCLVLLIVSLVCFT